MNVLLCISCLYMPDDNWTNESSASRSIEKRIKWREQNRRRERSGKKAATADSIVVFVVSSLRLMLTCNECVSVIYCRQSSTAIFTLISHCSVYTVNVKKNNPRIWTAANVKKEDKKKTQTSVKTSQFLYVLPSHRSNFFLVLFHCIERTSCEKKKRERNNTTSRIMSREREKKNSRILTREHDHSTILND